MSSPDQVAADDIARVRVPESSEPQAWDPYDVWRVHIYEPRRARDVLARATQNGADSGDVSSTATPPAHSGAVANRISGA